ncbi:MAG: 50S ribosomal protein L9 [Armatimonadetes bacterium]|nr:50S ribosomal protein L9 [Armatimonadota bacterium]
MQVILKQDVRDLGRAGELVDVKEGYARNFLLPKRLAVPATPGNLKDLQKRMQGAKEREARERAEAQGLGERLRRQSLYILHRAAEGTTRLHGSVTPQDIVEAIRGQMGTEIDRRSLEIREPIRTLGEHVVTLRLARGISVPVTLQVVEKMPEQQAASAEAVPAR